MGMGVSQKNSNSHGARRRGTKQTTTARVQRCVRRGGFGRGGGDKAATVTGARTRRRVEKGVRRVAAWVLETQVEGGSEPALSTVWGRMHNKSGSAPQARPPLALASRVKGRTGGGHVCASQITKRSRRAHNLENYLAKVNFEQTCFDRDDRPSVLRGYPRSCPRIQFWSARRLERGQGTAAEAHGCKCIQESAFAGLALPNRPQFVANRRGLRATLQGTATNVDSRP